MASPGSGDRMGSLCQTAIRRTATGAEVPGALYPSGSYFEPASDLAEGRPSHFSLEELCSRKCASHHDAEKPRSSSGASCCTFCPKALSRFVTSGFWPTAAGTTRCSYAANCWQRAQPDWRALLGTTPIRMNLKPTREIAVRAARWEA